MPGLRRRTRIRQPSRVHGRAIHAAIVVAIAALIATATPVSAANFPASYSGYHSFSEMVAEITKAEADHPSIVDVFTIGQSYQGRGIYAAKISDHVKTDEAEPEILVDALHHAREHLTVEQALYLLRILSDGYAGDATIRSLVDSREIWIVFALNPDGFEYDLTCTGSAKPPFCAWRKNRQPNAGTSAIGTDLNRNYDYLWACCGGSSGEPSSITYRGPRPFSAPETQVMRNFVNSRRIGGIQQIKAHVTLHTNGQLILWPYGHTRTDVPADMTRLDHDTFVAMGRAMAARNGYKPEQSSDLYITDGDQIDWMYGRHRIFSFTWELYPPETSTVWGDHYPPDEIIGRETSRNRNALLYLLDVGGCPYRAVDRALDYCGPFYDDVEGDKGWSRNPSGNDTATSGIWTRGRPIGTSLSGHPMQVGGPLTGSGAFVTGASGGTATAADVDGGTTTLRSAQIRLPRTGVGHLVFNYSFSHANNATAADSLRAWIEDAGGNRTRVWEQVGAPAFRDAGWHTASASISRWANQTIRLVFTATDGAGESTVEAALDEIRIQNPTRTSAVVSRP
jgi:hypothetical protein